MSSMNPYPGYEYAMFQMNGLNSSYPIKMEDPFLDSEPDRDEATPQGPLPYMSTFSKHTPHAAAVTMFYPQLSAYDHLHPFIMNNRRRSTQDPVDHLEPDSPSMNHSISNFQIKDTGRYKPLRARTQGKRRSEDEQYAMQDQEAPHGHNLDEASAEYNGKMRKSFFCRLCSKTYKFQTSLLRHNNKVHISKYQCPTCSRVFSRQAYLDVHTSKQGSSCYLETSVRLSRSRPSMGTICSTD